MIYGQLLRTLLNGDVELEDLFPVDINQGFYTGFPPSTQDKSGWGGSFQFYVDQLFEKGLIKTPQYVETFID